MTTSSATAGLLLFASLATSLAGQSPATLPLDSGTVVRFRWTDGRRESAVLLTPFAVDSTRVRYCRYPAPRCGPGTLNPARTGPTAELRAIEVRHGHDTGRGATLGALVGGGLGTLAWVLAQHTGESHGSVGWLIPLGLLEGAGMGALIGAFSDRWVPIREQRYN
jgi:hypothetical protein